MTESRRARYIADHFALHLRDGWYVAVKYRHPGRDVAAEFVGSDRAAICSRARREWGHFNYADEAEAFDRIFPGHGSTQKSAFAHE